MSTVEATKAQTSTSVVDTERPWPGLFPFTEEQHEFFFGRDNETDELFRHVKRDILTVLYSKSGLGKSSLLQAGLFPRLRKTAFLPVYIRLKYAQAAGSGESQVKAALQEAIQDSIDKGDLAEAASPAADEPLWEYLHRRSGNLIDRKRRVVYPVLVFDQFEEIFTRGEDNETARKIREELLLCLGDLVESPRIPQGLSERLAVDPNLATQFATQFDVSPTGYKFVVALRDEYVSSLDDLRNIPSLASATNRMGIKQLKGEQALLAVSKPNPELVTTRVSELIVRFVAGDKEGKPLDTLEVAPAILSLFCQELNKKRVYGKLPQITGDLVKGNADTIIDDFYHRCVDGKPAPVQRLIEEELVNESGYRDDIDLDEARKKLEMGGVPGSVIDELVEDRVLHIEDYRGRPRLELTHDVLLEPVKRSRERSREQRRENEAREKEEAEKALALAAAQERARLAEANERAAHAEAERARAEVERAARELEVKHLQELAAAAKENAETQLRLAEEQKKLAEAQAQTNEAQQKLIAEQAVWARKASLGITGLILLFMVTLVLAVIVFRGMRRAERASRSSGLASKARDLYSSNRDLGRNLALESVYVTWNAGEQALPEAHNALEWFTRSTLPVDSRPIRVLLSSDWKHIATINRDDTIRVKAAVVLPNGVNDATTQGNSKNAASAYPSQGPGAFPSPTTQGSGVGTSYPSAPPSTRPEADARISCQSESGTSFLIPESGMKTVTLWEATLINPAKTLLNAFAAANPQPAFSDDGRYVAFGRSSPSAPGVNPSDAILWKVDGGSACEWKTLEGASGGSGISALAFSPSENGLLAVGNVDGTVQLWDIRKPQPEQLATLKSKQTGAVAISFSRDGKRMAIAGSDGNVSLQEVETRKEIALLKGPSWVSTLTFSPKLLAIAYQNNSIWVWNSETEKPLKKLTISSPGAAAPPVIAFSRDGKRLVGASDMFAAVWDTDKWTILFSSPVSTGTITAIDMDSAGDQFLTVHDDGTLTIHTIRLQDEVSRAEKSVTEKYSDAQCEELAGLSACNDFYDNKVFNPPRGTDKSSATAQPQR